MQGCRIGWFVVASCCLIVFAVGRTRAADGPLGAQRPNIVVVLTDDQGYGDLGAHGNPVLKTPNLDRMRSESVRFVDWSVSPTCAPTRSVLMTGRHEFHNGVTHTIWERERLTLAATTLAQVVHESGYATGIFGKWHLGDEDAYQPQARGFDEAFIHGAGGIGQSYDGSCGDAPGNRYMNPVIRHNGKFEATQGYCTDVFFDAAKGWIGRQIKSDGGAKTKPFFCWIATNAPHAPLNVPDEWAAPYVGKSDGAAKFFGMIANIDANVGKLLAFLKEHDLEKNTLVIFMTDNGGTAGVKVFNAGMRGEKVTPHRGGTRGMSFWRWPGTLAPGDCAAVTAHLDFFPTIAELARAKTPADVAAKLEGFSLAPLLRDPASDWPEARQRERVLFTHVGRWQPGEAPVKYGDSSVRSQQYLFFPDAKAPRLFDLKADPHEDTDIAAAHPEVCEKLSKAYDAWWTATLPQLTNEKAYLTAPKINSFHEAYWEQYAGPGPNNVPPSESPSGKKKK